MRNPLRPRSAALDAAVTAYLRAPAEDAHEAAHMVILAVRCPGCGAHGGAPCARNARWEWHRGWTGPVIAGAGSPYFHARRVAAAEKVIGEPLWSSRLLRPPVSSHELHRAIRYALERLVEAAQSAYEQTSLNPKMTQIPDLTYVWEAVAELTEAEGGAPR